MLELDELMKHVKYDPESGKFTRVKKLTARASGGTSDSNISARYMSIRINGKRHQCHRLAFMYMKGRLPLGHVDHIDGNPRNNSWLNLREVSALDNSKNKAMDKRNKSGMSGVHWAKKEKRWKVAISNNGKKIHIGYFKELDSAVMERMEAEIEYDYHANHGRIAQC